MVEVVVGDPAFMRRSNKKDLKIRGERVRNILMLTHKLQTLYFALKKKILTLLALELVGSGQNRA